MPAFFMSTATAFTRHRVRRGAPVRCLRAGLLAILIALLPALAAAPAAAQGQDATQFRDALAGEWYSFDPDASTGSTCRLNLLTSALGSRFAAVTTDCAGELGQVASWGIVSNQMGLFAEGDQPIALLGGNQRRISGEFLPGGAPVILERAQGDGGNAAIAAAIQRHGCIYRGFGQECAENTEFAKPDFGAEAEASAEVLVLVNLNVRAQPRRDASVLGTVPANTCIRADACLRASDGIWCRARFGDDAGWLSKTAIRREQWAVMTYANGCGTGSEG